MTHTISRLLTAGAVAFACSVTFVQPSLAQGKGHGGGSSVTTSNGVNAMDRDTGAGRAGDRMSKEGAANTDGPNAKDRDTGQARAGDRNHN